MNEASCVQVEKESNSQEPDDGLRRHAIGLANSPGTAMALQDTVELNTRARLAAHDACAWPSSSADLKLVCQILGDDESKGHLGSDPRRSCSGRDTGRRLGQCYIHMRTPSIDWSRRSSRTSLRPLVRGRGTRTSQRASSKHVLMSSGPSLVSYPNSSTCAVAMKPMLW